MPSAAAPFFTAPYATNNDAPGQAKEIRKIVKKMQIASDAEANLGRGQLSK